MHNKKYYLQITVILTTRCERRLLFQLYMLSASSRDVVIDALVVIVYGNCQHFFCVGLANNIFVEVGVYLKTKKLNSAYVPKTVY